MKRNREKDDHHSTNDANSFLERDTLINEKDSEPTCKVSRVSMEHRADAEQTSPPTTPAAHRFGFGFKASQLKVSMEKALLKSLPEENSAQLTEKTDPLTSSNANDCFVSTTNAIDIPTKPISDDTNSLNAKMQTSGSKKVLANSTAKSNSGHRITLRSIEKKQNRGGLTQYTLKRSSFVPSIKKSEKTGPQDENKENMTRAIVSAHSSALNSTESLRTKFEQSRIDEIETILKYRAKASKFNNKARQEEQVQYIRKLKNVLRTVCSEIRHINGNVSDVESDFVAEKQKLTQRVALAENAAREAFGRVANLLEETKSLSKEKETMHREKQTLSEKLYVVEKTVEDSSNAQSDLEKRKEQLEEQVEQSQIRMEKLTKEVESLRASLSDCERTYEEKAKELERSHHTQSEKEAKRRNEQTEKLQSQVTKLLEDSSQLALDREKFKQQACVLEDELKSEREKRNRMEMEKCTMRTLHEALESRFASTQDDLAELKSKMKEKESELSRLIQSITEMQKLSSNANSKLDTEKRQLQDKMETLQRTNKELERSERNLQNELKDALQTLEKTTRERDTAAKQLTENEKSHQSVEIRHQEIAKQATVNAAIRQTLESQLKEMRIEHVAVNAQMEAVKFEMRNVQQNCDELKISYEEKVADLEALAKAAKACASEQVEKLRESNVSLKSEVATLRDRLSSVRDEDLEELCTVRRDNEILRLRLRETSNQGSQSIAEKDQLITELQEKIRQGEKARRLMHNTIQELRGNVRVFVRARPFLPYEMVEKKQPESIISCECDGQSLKITRPMKGQESVVSSFTFDKVFPPCAGQDVVFTEVSEFVQSSLDGYHVCLFSYGQTGSGKTHTMQGSGTGQMRGIIPRAIEKVLNECELQREEGWVYTTRVSFMEIYNETIKDLLEPTLNGNRKLCIKKDTRGNFYVSDLTIVDVCAMDQVEALMERASRARSVASTDMNAQSSRSHSLFTLYLQGVRDSDGIVLDGRLNLVDLAGSERASRSNVTGDRLKETQAINKSLSCLADVFTAIGNKASHIPFRNSKLTYLLQNCLSGDGKTLMMVNLSPTFESANETLCSLRFAKQVNQCELGKAKRQIKSKNDVK
ncbi:hypothetical protein ABG067_006925 [Albugo candida]